MFPGHSALLTLFVAVAGFITGMVSSSVFDVRGSARTVFGGFIPNPPIASPPLDRMPTQPDPTPPLIGPVQEPLGLSWYKQAYSNPWSFSTMRTGIDDLFHAYDKILERDGSLPRVVVSFTSLPRRFSVHARSMITILKTQSYLPDAIYIAVPETSRRSNETFKIPKWMTSDPLITVLRPQRDLGPATKLIPALEAELRLGNKHTRIITVDDDNEGSWGTNSLLQLFAYSLYFENAAIGLTGWNVTCMVSDAHCGPEESGVPQRQFRDRLYNFVRPADDYACHTLFDWLPDYFASCMGAVRKNYIGIADVLEGYKGVVYQPRFFNMAKLKTVLDDKTPEFFLLVDDVWFSGWLGVQGVQRLVVNPAIHENSEIATALQRYSGKRNISSALPKMGSDDIAAKDHLHGEPERGLHSLGFDFVEANHKGVRWFEKFGAWTKDLWKRPKGFKYPNEEGRKVKVVERMVVVRKRKKLRT